MVRMDKEPLCGSFSICLVGCIILYLTEYALLVIVDARRVFGGSALSWSGYANGFARSEILRFAQNDKVKVGVGDGRFGCPTRVTRGFASTI